MSIPLTVALLTYNRSQYLKEAIAGIQAQTYTNFEFLILDNGSTDDTPQVVLGIQDKRIRYVRNPPGSAVEFNGVSAFHIARGKRIIVTHDDDIMEPTMLERQMQLMDKHPDVVLVWTNVSLMNQDGKTVQDLAYPNRGNRIFKQGEYILNFLSERLWPVPSTMMLYQHLTPRRWVDEHYLCRHVRNEEMRGKNVAGTADVYLPANFNTFGAVAFLGEPLLRYRLHPSQGTNTMDLSTPSIHLYTSLKQLIELTPLGHHHRLTFDSYVVRYRTQQVLSSSAGPEIDKTERSHLLRLFRKITRHRDYRPEAAYPILPLAIMITQTGARRTPPDDNPINDLKAPPKRHYTSATRAYYAWYASRRRGRNLFAAQAARRIVLLGSALVAPLLILEAREAGCEVVCCVDSNIYRHGQKLLGVDIHPPAWLASHRDDFDLLIFTSEKDQEGYLENMIEAAAQGKIPTMSWKELVDAARPYRNRAKQPPRQDMDR